MMRSMIWSSRRGLVLAIAGVSALLVVVGIAYATTTCGCGDPADSAGSNGSNAVPAIVITATETPNTPQVSPTTPPDTAVSSPAQPADGNAGGPVSPATHPSTAPVPDGPVAAPGSSPTVIVEPAPPPSEIPPVPGEKPLVSGTPIDPSTGVNRTTPASPPTGVSMLPRSDLPPLKPDFKRSEAPIDGLDVAVMESYPPQYMLQIKAGLPNGCAEKAGYEASISGTTITVKVYNASPTAGGICTMIYGMYDLNLNFGSGFVSGQVYTVNVNDRTTTFKAQ
jgi:hypothetical protein